MVKLRQQTGLAHKRDQPGLEGLLVGRGPHPERLPLRAPGQRRGHVLLDGHRPVQGMIKRLVDHAKPAHPQQPQDLELRQAGAGGSASIWLTPLAGAVLELAVMVRGRGGLAISNANQ